MPVPAEQPVSYRPVPFNFVDLEEKAAEYLARIRAEATRITTEARNEVARLREITQREYEETRREAEKVRAATEELNKRLATESASLEQRRAQLEKESREKGHAEGHKAGYEEGRASGYADGELQANLDFDERVKREAGMILEQKLTTLMPAVEDAATKIQSAQHFFLAHWERAAIQVAAAMAHRVIMRELPGMSDVPLDLIREALELGVGGSTLKLRMSPDDHAALLPRVEMLTDRLAGSAKVEIVPDDRVSPGGCILETALGTIDQRIESRLDRIQMELV